MDDISKDSAPAWREDDRLAALERYRVLDTAPEADFDDIVRIAAQICGVPIALISLIDDKRQWFKAAIGLDVRETPREVAFCNVAIQQDDMLVVADAASDPRFQANPLVVGDPSIRFYAGAQLVTPDGFPLGTLCVIDDKPRALSNDQTAALSALARQVVNQLELRAALERQRQEAAHREMLGNELQHRSKNTLALVQALVRQTMRNTTSVADAQRAIEARLVALSRAYDLLQPGQWTAASLEVVVSGSIADAGSAADRVHAGGPALNLRARPALALSMVLHELVTNAAKYGALSNETGRVDVDWAVRGVGEAAVFEFNWRELGGPPVSPPSRRGFGSRLIAASVVGELSGVGDVEYAPAGVRWTLKAPAAGLLEP